MLILITITICVRAPSSCWYMSWPRPLTHGSKSTFQKFWAWAPLQASNCHQKYVFLIKLITLILIIITICVRAFFLGNTLSLVKNWCSVRALALLNAILRAHRVWVITSFITPTTTFHVHLTINCTLLLWISVICRCVRLQPVLGKLNKNIG